MRLRADNSLAPITGDDAGRQGDENHMSWLFEEWGRFWRDGCEPKRFVWRCYFDFVKKIGGAPENIVGFMFQTAGGKLQRCWLRTLTPDWHSPADTVKCST